ncbi:hypothetical protein EON64_07030, partial [archaeon]
MTTSLRMTRKLLVYSYPQPFTPTSLSIFLSPPQQIFHMFIVYSFPSSLSPPLLSHIEYFWRALEAMTPEERGEFVNFCSGRSR